MDTSNNNIANISAPVAVAQMDGLSHLYILYKSIDLEITRSHETMSRIPTEERFQLPQQIKTKQHKNAAKPCDMYEIM